MSTSVRALRDAFVAGAVRMNIIANEQLDLTHETRRVIERAARVCYPENTNVTDQEHAEQIERATQALTKAVQAALDDALEVDIRIEDTMRFAKETPLRTYRAVIHRRVRIAP